MNNHPTINETLTRLDALKKAVQDFAVREAKLNNDFEAQTAKAQFEVTLRQQKLEAFAEQQLANAATDLAADQTRARAKLQNRAARVERVQASLTQRIGQQITSDDREWNQKTQLTLTEIEKVRDMNLAHAADAQHGFRQQLDVAETNLQELSTKARGAFGGYGRFRRWLNNTPVESSLPDDYNLIFGKYEKLEKQTVAALKRFQKMPLPLLFRFIPIWLIGVLLLGTVVAAPVLAHFGRHDVSNLEAELAILAFVIVDVIYWLGGRFAAPPAKTIADNLTKAQQCLALSREKSEAHYQVEQAQIRTEFETSRDTMKQTWRQALRDIELQNKTWQSVIEDKVFKLGKKMTKWHEAELFRVQQRHIENLTQLKKEDLARFQTVDGEYKSWLEKTTLALNQNRDALVAEWKNQVEPLWEQLRAANEAAEKNFPAWTALEKWHPDYQNAAKFARLEINTREFFQTQPSDKRLAWPGPETFSVPLSLVFPHQSSILFESGKFSGEEAFGSINNIIFRLLSTTPPGRLSFTIFDPVGLGQNFATLMHLADYEDSFINSRIWTQTTQFEEKLSELNEHMEKIIQMYLRNEYATIAEYNAEAGSVAEKYHFLVIASFPVNFNESVARKLRNIAASGARCGVHTLIHWDQRNALPQDFVPDELRANSIGLVHNGKSFELSGWRAAGARLVLDPPPPAEFATRFLQQIGESNKDAARVEVPFQQIAPTAEKYWTEETTELLRVPIGRASATKLQYLEIGSGTRQHTLIAGKTGSGKSTLFHVIITNLALRCSPEQVEFYLVDFKKGVEFKCYAGRHLPHAKVVAIESDREFALSVLQRVDEELRRRGDLFRKLGAQDLAGYKRSLRTANASPSVGEPMPRVLLMIDEFQEFFVEEDHVSQGAAMLLDRIVRQGRAFGIHVMLGSQTLGGAYTLARATIGQMAIRIALQCNEADAMLIMDQDNPAPRLLSRPGEGIYNDASGSIEGNSPFQAVWLSDRERDAYLAEIRARADALTNRKYNGPIVFEGNAPADLTENFLFRAALEKNLVPQIPAQSSVWLGAPNAIKGPADAVFRRQSGSNLLVVAQNEERTLNLLSIALISLAAQFPKHGARFVLLDATPPATAQREFLDRVAQIVPQETVRGNNANLAEVMDTLAQELKTRTENEAAAATEIFVFVNGLQNFKKLRQEDEFSFSSSNSGATPATTLLNLINEGPARGIHVLVACDTYNNLSRYLGRKALTEFEMRVVFQMSATDSASLVDAPNASALGLHRALYHNDREGRLETFRPYAQPENDWLEMAAGNLQRRE